ncbi:hypothetical protein [Flavobacterium ginsengiterrae]|uniref:Uncharacterized protein n=1 Tax=Flavobacterium ginsengiterrae TaxID=871695 RepID=A0ABP7GHI0_9FLAO
MAKYVIHKVSFFFTDDSLIVLPQEEVTGSVLSTFNTIEEAKTEKAKQDIISVQKLSGSDVKQFYIDSDNDKQIYADLKEYYLSEFNIEIEENEYFNFPENISEQQAEKFMEILNLTFHYIMEYEDDEDPKDFDDYDQIHF